MAYDEDLADRLREVLAPEHPDEKRMFGGLAFLVGGRMAVAASGRGGLLVRCDPATTNDLLGPHVEPMVMRGRQMTGWLHVSAPVVTSDAALADWVGRAVAYVRELPS